MRIYCLSVLMALASILLLTSCDDSAEMDELYFFGDSLVARWDLQESFPTLMTHNDGCSGSGIEYLESAAHRYNGKDVVVLIGSNNMSGINDQNLEFYTQKYMCGIDALNAHHVYLLSLPPRNFKGDSDDLNDMIVKFNETVKDMCGRRDDITYVDIFDALCYKGSINMEYSLDGLHLNVYGYQIVTKLLTEKL